ncbi:MAG: 16S rRNA (cytidine(1402)-2'-O)-methyltransferase [Chloroflexi bacterium]|nr:16S rRNA (cytidine(1402)-2'-O)-methyltransferase [Chloroflexota bacterium]MCY3715666.1 16S rRNA (cytidine(1402)-2'-O)-methyltransferase [Chloroflexota bacterium]MDE2650596.1 16S rRNA (cytidine(1402)-2'-O)-methyltransferase [Chloroflexota bacterium]MXV94014.1 16S rRNA (cytidine(1402)-2'-O)-methyltransferase [Chloroflexota bacterium]MXX82017.1 16S rRNA (cytidine(1402)-2'-O)-methyltransferase [Chloroflexota bacterium]
MGTLYIVPTPIGNLEDMTLRGLRVLREVALIAAEDTRASRVLLRHFGINTPMTSYHEHNKLGKLEALFAALDAGDVALISDAGTPGISDPGLELIQAAIAREYPVLPLPGACALTTALVGAGLATDRFLYVGFLPRKPSALRELLAGLRERRETVVAYESPYRLGAALGMIVDVLGAERRVCVAREMSKKFEQFYRGAASELHQHFAEESPRGEVTLVIAGAAASSSDWSQQQVEAALAERLAAGEALSKAARGVARLSGWKKSAIYQLGIGMTRD